VKDWQPKESLTQVQGIVHPSILRAIELRGLEIPVGEWTKAFTKEVGSPGIAEILMGHINDEENHDRQLEYVAEYLNHTEISDEAMALTNRWLDHPSHPLVKKTMLEAGVFFPILGMLGRYAKGDLYLQAVRQWISSDEAAHVASSRLIISYMDERHGGGRYKIPADLLELVVGTIRFICGGIDEGQWLKSSRSGITTGKIYMGTELTTVSVPEAFTQISNNQIMYQRVV